MWIQAGFAPDTFYAQTPRHFQLAMEGVRKRLSNEADGRIEQAWQTGAFAATAQSKRGLKPLNHYLKKPPRKMGNSEMLANMRIMAARVNKKFEGGV